MSISQLIPILAGTIAAVATIVTLAKRQANRHRPKAQPFDKSKVTDPVIHYSGEPTKLPGKGPWTVKALITLRDPKDEGQQR